MQATLEQTATNEAPVTRCELGEVAEKIPGHPDYKLLITRWSVCMECKGYNPNCPRHPDYL